MTRIIPKYIPVSEYCEKSVYKDQLQPGVGNLIYFIVRHNQNEL